MTLSAVTFDLNRTSRNSRGKILDLGVGVVAQRKLVTSVTVPDWLGGIEVRIESNDSDRDHPVVFVREPGQEWVSAEDSESRVRSWRMTTYEQPSDQAFPVTASGRPPEGPETVVTSV